MTDSIESIGFFITRRESNAGEADFQKIQGSGPHRPEAGDRAAPENLLELKPVFVDSPPGRDAKPF